MKLRWKATSFLLFVLAAPCLVFSDPPAASNPFPTDQPIEMKMNLSFFGLLGNGMRYSIGGKPISRYEDFRDLINPLHDEEATDLLRGAQDDNLVAWLFYASGAVAGVDFALVFKPDPLLGVNWFDRIATGFVAAQVFWTGGAIFEGDAEARKFNAIQRYNDLLKQEDESFLGFTPRVCLVGQGLGLDLDRPF
jgi:hypothetical protein